jgi:ribose transport system permease protein
MEKRKMSFNIQKNTRYNLVETISLSHSWPVIIIYGVLIVMLFILSTINPTFPSVFSVTNLLSTALPLIFAALAQTSVVLVKGIDLSIGPAMSLIMVIAAKIMKDSPVSIGLTICICILIGLLIGLLNGLMVVVARLQPIIVTLASSSILAGLALYIMPQPGGYIPAIMNTIATGALVFFPVPLIILIGVLLLIWLPLHSSRIGQSWFAIGGNEAGAYYSGINTAKAKLSAFLVAGLFASLGGLTLAFQTLTGDPMIGDPFTLNSIAAVVLGGTSLAGGRGGAIGTIGGVLVLTIAVDILFFFQVSAYYQYVFSGAIVIFALALVAFSEFIRSKHFKQLQGQLKRKGDNS